MSALAVLIPVSLGMGLAGLAGFFWAMRRGQFDDPEGNAWRVIAPELPPRPAPPTGRGEPDRPA